MQPIVATSGKVAQLRYELPHRVHDSAVYPVKAPNGSTIILYGHETGVRIAWRGGRRFKKNVPAQKQPSRPAKVNGAKDDAIMIIDSDDEQPASAPVPVAEFEEEDEELDPNQPYPSIIQQIDLALNTEVLHLTVPNVPAVSSLRPADSIPTILQTRLVCAVTCADSTVRIITLPLSPPTDAAKAKPPKGKSQFGEEIVKIHGHQSMARGITMTWTARGEPTYKHEAEEMDVDGEEKPTATPGRRHRRQQSEVAAQPKEDGFDVLVATHSAELGGLLKIWRFQLTDSSIKVSHPIAPYKTLTLRKPASRIAFSTAQYPKRRHSQLLIADTAGTTRIYDVHASSVQRRATGGAQSDPGAFIATFRSTFESIKNSAYTPAILAARKPILDAAWTSDGRHILALLADGEWGVWDVDRSGPSPPADPSAFSLRAFIGTTEKESSGAPASPKRSGRSSLAPMTPNTRRRKEETLFQGNLTNTSVASPGGISVQSLHLTGGSVSEDSIIIWYGSEIYRIADLTKFWGRVAAGVSSATSLPSPGLAQLPHVSLYGASITSISQFDSTAEAARLARPRDLLILAEYRLLITTTTTQTLGRDLNSMLAREQSETEDTRRSDQALLSQGELDLGGMDRMLDDMEDSGTLPKSLTLGNPRKVLFASSAA